LVLSLNALIYYNPHFVSPWFPPNCDVSSIKKKYFDIYTKDMGTVVASEIKRNFEFLILNCLQASEEEYDESVYTGEKMKEDIHDLYKMGQGKIGCDEKSIFKFLCTSPPEYLKKLNLAYADEHGVTLLHSFKTELKGYAQDAAEFLIGMKIKPYEEVAKLIAKASKGIGTNETLLSSTLIRYQSILKDVQLAHVELYGKTLADRVKEETGRVFEDLLLEILGAADAA
jgi:Annexin